MSFLSLCAHVVASSAAEGLLAAALIAIGVFTYANWPTIRAALGRRHGRRG
jgi:hypothetical protein